MTEELLQIAKLSNLDNEMRDRGLKVLKDMPEGTGEGKSANFLAAAALFSQVSPGSHVTLSQLLKAASVRLVDFFIPYGQFLASLGADVEAQDRRRLVLQQKFVIGQVLFREYCNHVVPSESVGVSGLFDHVFAQVWCVFLLAKAELIGDPPALDLGNGTALLEAVLNILREELPISLDSVEICPDAELAERVRRFVEGLVASKTLRLPNESTWSEAERNSRDRRTLAEVLKASIESLHHRYDFLLHSLGDFDERYYLEDVAMETPVASMVRGTQLSPLIGSRTPVTAASSAAVAAALRASSAALRPGQPAMAMIQWVQTLLRSRPTPVTCQLQSYFVSCETNPMDEIRERLLICNQRMMPYTPTMRDAVRDLYYLLLEETLVSEDERIEALRFDRLLHSDPFHRALIATSIYIVVCTFRIIQTQLSEVLNIALIDPFQWLKVLESTGPVLRRLHAPAALEAVLGNASDEIVLNHMWADDSPLFAGSDADRTHLYSSARAFVHRHWSNQAASRTASVAPPAFEPPADADPLPPTMQLLWRAIWNVTARRATVLVLEHLAMPEIFLSRVMAVLMHVLTIRLAVLRRRSLDVAIVAAVQAVASCAFPKGSPFACSPLEIWRAYATLTAATPDLRTHVLLEAPDTFGTLDEYVDRVFVPATADIVARAADGLSSATVALGNSARDRRTARRDLSTSDAAQARHVASAMHIPHPSYVQFGQMRLSPARGLRSRVMPSPSRLVVQSPTASRRAVENLNEQLRASVRDNVSASPLSVPHQSAAASSPALPTPSPGMRSPRVRIKRRRKDTNDQQQLQDIESALEELRRESRGTQ